ncbi:FAD-binding protein, partial [bacterium]|nr:FAD-binding protein [bacterium]
MSRRALFLERVDRTLVEGRARDVEVDPREARDEFLEEQAGATQSTGMFKAWNSTPSGYAVAAEDASDIQAAVNFARKNRVRVVVKGTGHDYYGRSCGPDESLLIWTHNMRQVTVHDKSFVPKGAPAGTPPVSAVTTTAGNRWLEAYKIASANGLYIQGGGCTSVGACGGFALGGGFGSFSKRFGSGAAGVLE